MLSSIGKTKRMLPAAPIVDVATTAVTMNPIPINHFVWFPAPFFLRMNISPATEISSSAAEDAINNGISPISGTVNFRSTDTARRSDVRATKALIFRRFAVLSIELNNPAFPLNIILSGTKLATSDPVRAEHFAAVTVTICHYYYERYPVLSSFLTDISG